MSIEQVLLFCQSASIQDKNRILCALNGVTTATPTRAQQTANTLAALGAGSPVQFTYDGVGYTGTVEKINRATATVKITGIDGTPRNRIIVGMAIRVSASILARA